MRILIVILSLITQIQFAHSGSVRVVDGDTLIVSGQTYRLFGIDTPEFGQKCKKANGRAWKCGKEATKTMMRLVTNGNVVCDNRGRDGYDRIIAVCLAGSMNLNEEMIKRGLAWAFIKYADDYVPLEQKARKQKIGIWQAPTQTAWDYRAERWNVAEQKSPKGCPIKGNISRNGRIYHAPWSPWYSRTKVSVKKGERWFCSEREAIDAGWRAPLWGR